MASDESSSEDEMAEVFGPLALIPESSLVSLAIKIREKELGRSTSSGTVVSRCNGSYNLVYIVLLDDFKLVIRIPASGWGENWSETAMRALESQAATLRLLSSRTTIPVPEVYALDTSRNNEIGAPFICTSFLPGKTVIKTWFEDSGPIPMEERRLLTLTSLAGCMAQLSAFAFDKIGSLCGDSPDAIPLGPCFDWDEKDDGTIGVDASGPFDSTDDYLREHFQLRNSKSEWGVAEDKLIVVIKSCLPVHNPGEGFVLCPPDFDAQNILTDSDGNVTGIIDWDLVQTLPRCVGYSRYPSWITRDWDPLMYGWPHLKDTENSPEELERYREHYCRALGAALAHRGDWSYTKKSHIWEAGWIALLNTVNRLEICRKLLQAAVGDDDDATDILYDLGTGALEKEKWDSIVDSLTKLFSVHVDPQ